MTDEPQVFHLITRLLKGGAESKVIETIHGLSGYEFVIGHGMEYDADQIDQLERDEIATRRFQTIRHYNPIAAGVAVASVARYLRQNDFDIIHTHSTEAGIIGRLAASLAGANAVVHTVHGIPFAEDRHPILNRFVLECEKIAARQSDRIVTNADRIANEYLKRGIGSPEQYTTVYSGIDIDHFREASPAIDIDGKGVRLLMVSRLSRGKGFYDLFDAIDQLDTSDLSVYLVGDGPLRDELESTIKHRELPVSTLGYRDDIASIMAACDVFVLPSYREGTPRVITEAMASGLPVIATDIAGIPEQVEDETNGFLHGPGDIDELISCLQCLISSPDRREAFGAASRKRVQKFSIDTMLSDINAVYRELLEPT